MYSLVFNLGTLLACGILGYGLVRKRPGANGTALQSPPFDESEDSPVSPDAP